MIKTYKVFAVSAGLALLFGSHGAPALGSVVNGSFENGLSNWTVVAANSSTSIGTAVTTGSSSDFRYFYFIPGSTTETTVPQDGSFQAKLGSPTGPLSANSSFSASTSIYQDINVLAGDVLTFSWNFVYSDVQATTDDLAFYGVTLIGGNSTKFVLDRASNNSVANYQTSTYTFASSGNYRIEFGVGNAGNNVGTSYAYFDNIQVVPEPSGALGTLMLLFGGLGLRRSRLRVQ
jgi:hypothetical protein